MNSVSRKLGLTTVFVFVAVLSFTVVASAQTPGLYFTPKIGYSHLQADTQFMMSSWSTGTTETASNGHLAFGLAGGYDFNRAYEVPIRIEFEYIWRDKDEIAEYVEVGAQSFFANFYFDGHNSTPITPYIGGGVGLARVDVKYDMDMDYDYDDSRMGNTETNFAWNIGAGAAWAINDHVTLDVGYRYADFGNVGDMGYQFFISGIGHSYDLGYDLDTDVTTHEVLMGLRYTF